MALVGAGLHMLGDRAMIAWLLVGLALSALIGGAALLPLLTRIQAAPVRAGARDAPGLPWRFLVGSIAGIVALGAPGKGAMHLPATTASPEAGTMLVLLTAGRTVAALSPLEMPDSRRGLRLLAGLYASAALGGPLLLAVGELAMPVLLGAMLGVTNLVGWALLPRLARGASGFARYTMVSNLGLGGAGLAMTAALGGRSSFAVPAGLTSRARKGATRR